MARKLTEKQKRFCDEYLIDLNATQAAIRAGYSEKTAYSQGQRLLKNVEIQILSQKLMSNREKRTGISQDKVLREYAKIGFFDPRKLFHDDGTPKGISQLDDDTAAALSGLDVIENWEYDEKENKKVKNGYTKKYKITDKKGALDSLARHLGMFNKDKLQLEHSGEVNNPFAGLTTADLKKLIKNGGNGG